MAIGCSSDPVSTCEHVVCNVGDGDCVQRVADAVGCDLGEDTIVPTVRFVTSSEAVERGVTTLTGQQQQDRADWFRGLSLMKLLPDGYEPEQATADALQNIAAFYDPQTDEVFIVVDHVSDPQFAYEVLVHELVHAYQDHYRDLEVLAEEHGATHDRRQGLRGLIEGEATLFENLANLQLRGLHPNEVDWFGYFNNFQVRSLERGQDSETPYIDAPLLFPYAWGTELVFDGWRGDTYNAIDNFYGIPPDSVRQVMAGNDSWPDDFSNADVEFDARAVPLLPAEEYEFVTGAHLSIWLVNAMMQRTVSTGLWAEGLRDVAADYLSVFRKANGEVVSVWRIDNGAGLGEQQADLVHRIDDDLVLINSSDGLSEDVLSAIGGWQAPDDAIGELTPRRVGRCQL